MTNHIFWKVLLEIDKIVTRGQPQKIEKKLKDEVIQKMQKLHFF